MHVVQVLPALVQGGVERGVVDFNRELVRRGHASTVVSAGGPLAERIAADGGRHVTLDVRSKNPLTALSRARALRRLLDELKPDILHARSRVPAWLCRLANRDRRFPFVTTVHGFNSVNRYSAVMVSGDRVIYGSTAIRDYILAHYRVDPARLRYVPRGIDVHYFDPAKADRDFIERFRAEHGLADRRIAALVGRITEWKGHEVFIRAMAAVQRRAPEWAGLIVGHTAPGKEEYLEHLRKLAQEVGAEVRFAGPQERVREIYALSDLVVSAASSKPETFGRTAAEAMAMDRPVVASAHGGTLDIVRDGIDGLLFPPGDADALADRILQAAEFAFRGMREHIVRNFSLERMTEAELAVYAELL